MSDRFNDQGTLDNVLLSPHLTLASKRAMLLVSHFFHMSTNLHLCQRELHVSHFDCTIANARFVLNVLMPRVEEYRRIMQCQETRLLVCARDEFFAPKMDLAYLAKRTTVRVNANRCFMGNTAAFFLGHALAKSDGSVRLGMGRKKSLPHLRERERVWLDDHERACPIDCLLMQPCLMANAERRIDAFDGAELDLSDRDLGAMWRPRDLTDQAVEAPRPP